MADQRPPDPQKYPKWLYKGGKSELVENEKEEKALGAGWSNSPAPPQAPTPMETAKSADAAKAEADAKAAADAKAKADAAAKANPVK